MKNKQYLVSEKFLLMYRKLCEDYISHYVDCEIYQTEFCTCGMSDLIKKLKQIEKTSIQEIK